MSNYINKSVGELLGPFEAHLLDVGYQDIQYFGCPSGVAAATHFEWINDDGHPIRKGRFDIDKKSPPASIIDGLSRLTQAHIGRYRALVFFLTGDRFTSDQAPKSFAKQRQFLGKGLKFLDDSLKGKTINRNYQFMMFAYEYCVFKKGDPRFVVSSRWYGIDHLRRSDIVTGIP